MSTVPDRLGEKLEFFEQHMPVWSAAAASIGLTVSQITDMAGLVAAARTAFDTAIDARSVSRSATVGQNAAMDAMGAFGGDLIKTIRAFAETTGDVDVYTAAQIPPPAPPTPAGPPAQPTDLAAALRSPFGLALTWKGSAARGTYFGVWRKLSGETAYVLIGTAKTREYNDDTVPAGTNGVAYYITAYRDEFAVNSGVLTVAFGVGAAGGLSIAA